ncbi:RPAP1-like protein, partial [Chaetomium sp. MPI-SDFR-AT-0129]
MDGTLGILDVQEREVGDATPPTFPTAPAPSTTGFPAHKKRVSAFKKQRQGNLGTGSQAPASSRPQAQNANAKPGKVDERRGIDQENKAVLNSMSPEEIAEAQKELYEGMDPKFIQMLLRRANLDEPTGPSPFDVVPSEEEESSSSKPPQRENQNHRQVTVEDDPEESAESAKPTLPTAIKNNTTDKPNPKPKKTVTFDEDAAPPVPPSDLTPITSTNRRPPPKTTTDTEKPDNTTDPSADLPHNTHFPPPPAVPDLDPSDPDFLSTMHQKYFPSLPSDPSKLAWMAPLPTPHSPADRESPYYPGQSSLPVSALRFDFRGALLPPRVSRDLPVTLGLHHHGEAPEAAGYTIPELARLARSSVAAQRCIAYQTLGRMLYRLGKGEWGEGVGGRGGEED